MIILHGFGTGFGLPEISPLVTTTGAWLKIAYRKQPATRRSPREQPPHIGDGIGTPQRALVWALERMVEHYVDRALAGARWGKRENFTKRSSRRQKCACAHMSRP
jgi:hypothetical protein